MNMKRKKKSEKNSDTKKKDVVFSSLTPISYVLKEFSLLPLFEDSQYPSSKLFIGALEEMNIRTLEDLSVFLLEGNPNSILSKINEKAKRNGYQYYFDTIWSTIEVLNGLLVSSPIQTVYDRFQNKNAQLIISSGDPVLDDFLDGGFRTQMIYEICGESSCGKTQLCLQMLFQCILPREMGGLHPYRSLYITTEHYPESRITELLKVKVEEDIPFVEGVLNRSLGKNWKNEDYVLDRIFVRTEVVKSLEEFKRLIFDYLAKTMDKSKLKLIVIDSIAAIYRSEFDYHKKGDIIERTNELINLTATLRDIANEYNCCIILTNQAKDTFIENSLISFQAPSMEKFYLNKSTFLGNDKKQPALGLSWSNCVNARIMLSKIGTRNFFSENESRKKKRKLNDVDCVYSKSEIPESENCLQVRKMKVIFAPMLKDGKSIYFVITKRGIKGMEPEEDN